MEKHYVNTENNVLNSDDETGDHSNKKFDGYKSSSPYIRECFREYSLQEKVDVLKNILIHNERNVQPSPMYYKKICKIKKVIGVKECLQPIQETPFQTIISELRNTVMNSYWNKEVGKTRYQIQNLPVGMDPQVVTFGKKCKFNETMAELLKQTAEETDAIEENVHEMYKKSHCNYLPAEQINRDYTKPFDQNLWFGKSWNADVEGIRVKERLTSFNDDPKTVVDSTLAEFIERSRPRVGEVKNLKNASLYMNMTHGKVAEKREASESIGILSDCSVNNDVIIQQRCLQYINTLRRKFKGHDQEISFSDIYEDMLSFDKDYTTLLPEKKVYSILRKYKILINETLLTPLLDGLQIRKERNVKYKELLQLLNWKYHFPTLSKIEKIPLECQYYTTTYNTTLADIDKIDIANIPAAGILCKGLDKTTAYSLIVPNIFTRHGLSPSDLSKLRNKEEINNIFETIGVEFPDDCFDFLWKEGLKRSGNDNVSVETFRNLLDEYDDLISKKNNSSHLKTK